MSPRSKITKIKTMKSTKNKNARFVLKALALFTLVAFACTDMLIFPARSFASTGSTVLPGGQKAQELSAASKVWNERLPSEWGKIEEISRVPRATDNVPRNENYGPWPVSQKFVVFIQDAHDSLEAQENIARMITHLVRNYGVRTVFEEGFEGKVPTDDFFGFIKDPALKERTAAFFMDKLRVGGAEYAHINRDRHLGASVPEKAFAAERGARSMELDSDFELIGADSFALHQKGIRDYQESEKSRQTIEKDLSSLEQELKSVIFGKLSKEFKQWLKFKERFSQGQLPLLDYLKWTLDIRRTSLPPKESGTVYPNIERVLSGDETRIKAVDLSGLFREIEGVEAEIISMGLKTGDERQVFYYYQNVLLLKKLSRVQVSDAEFDALKARFAGLTTRKIGEMISNTAAKPLVLSKRWESQLRSALDFYETARLRDSSIAKALDQYLLPGSAPAALVYGGFHQENIKRILKEKGIDYVIVSPRISAPSPRHEAYYKRLMDVGYHDFEATLALRTGSRVKPLVAMGELGRAEVRKVAADLASGMTPEMIERSFPARRSVSKATRSEARERLNMTIRYSDAFYRALEHMHASERERVMEKLYTEELVKKALIAKRATDFGIPLWGRSSGYSELKWAKQRILFKFEISSAYPEDDPRHRQITFYLYWNKKDSSNKQNPLDDALQTVAAQTVLNPNMPQDADKNKIDELNKWLYNESEETEELQVESRPSGLVLGGLQHVDSLHGFVGLFMGDITQGGSPVVLPIREMRQALALAHHDPKAAARIWVGEELADAEKTSRISTLQTIFSSISGASIPSMASLISLIAV